MRKKTKIIHFLSHGPPNSAYVDLSTPGFSPPEHHIKTTTFPFWVGFWRENFFVMVAEEIFKRSKKYSLVECWRPYLKSDKIYSKQINGVTHRLFPSIKPKKIRLKHEHILVYEKSPLMIEKLKQEIDKYNVIIHLHGFPGGGTNRDILRELDLSSVPVIVQHRGGSFKYERKRYFKQSIFRKFLSEIYKMIEYIESRTIYSKNIDMFLSLSISQMKTFKKMNLKPVLYLKDGRNPEDFPQLDKKRVRKELGLPQDEKLMLYVGPFDEIDGVEKIISIYNRIKSKYNLRLILVGGQKEDKFYDLAKESGAVVVLRVPREKLIPYYNACDFTIDISTDYMVKTGGISFVTIEGMLCGSPAVSRNLINFIGTTDERNQIGEVPLTTNEDEIIHCVKKIINNSKNYSNCREIIKKYYGTDVTISKNLKIYDYLTNKYYGN